MVNGSLDLHLCIESLDRCTTEEELQGVGQRIARDDLISKEDKERLKPIYRECLEAIRFYADISTDEQSPDSSE